MSKTKMQCVVSGKVVSVRPDIYNQRVEKFGSEEVMLKSYISSESKRLLREGKSVDEIRTMANTMNDKSLQSASELETAILRVMKTPPKVKLPSEPKIKKAKTVDVDVESFLNNVVPSMA